jgi:lysophospholipase L1-like esterase
MIAGSACTNPSVSASPARAPRPEWTPTWSPSMSATALRPPAGTADRVPTYANTTIREIIRTTIGGDHVQIRISNEYGDKPIAIGSAHLALRESGSTIRAGTDRALTFGGKPSVVVRTGAVVTSDPIAFDVPQLGDLAISLFLPDSTRTTTRHALGVQTTYIAKTGNHVDARTFSADTTMLSWLFLSAVEVTNPRVTGTIVAIGNSITDGYAATPDSNRRWPDVLARRLLTSSEPVKAVVNAGISGNRVLTFGAGPSLVSRFDRDVLMQPGVSHVILLEAINDISRDSIDVVSADDIIYGYRQMIDRAHERGIVIYGATLTPFERLSDARQAKREAINQWIRTGGAFDGVIDFDKVTRDPNQPNRFLPLYDSGDHLHPSDAGYKAMGESIDLALFRRTRP